MTEPRRFGKYSKVIRELEDTIRTLCQQMERIVAEKDAEIERLKTESTMTSDQIKYMVDRFLGWRLPETFNPDGGVHFEGIPGVSPMPIGTNILTTVEATAMIRHMVEGLPHS